MTSKAAYDFVEARIWPSGPGVRPLRQHGAGLEADREVHPDWHASFDQALTVVGLLDPQGGSPRKGGVRVQACYPD